MDEKFRTAFDSTDIGTADQFESDAIDFRNWFVNQDYVYIQDHFDEMYPLAIKVAKHYRPKVQTAGCDIICHLMQEAAPAQIKRIRKEIVPVVTKLCQVGNTEVIPSLLPIIPKMLPLVFTDPSCDEFHELFGYIIETWEREATSDMGSFLIASEMYDIAKWMGLVASRYAPYVLDIVSGRLKRCESRQHALQYLNGVKGLVEFCQPTITVYKDKITEIVARAMEIGGDWDMIKSVASDIEKGLESDVLPPKFL